MVTRCGGVFMWSCGLFGCVCVCVCCVCLCVVLFVVGVLRASVLVILFMDVLWSCVPCVFIVFCVCMCVCVWCVAHVCTCHWMCCAGRVCVMCIHCVLCVRVCVWNHTRSQYVIHNILFKFAVNRPLASGQTLFDDGTEP